MRSILLLLLLSPLCLGEDSHKKDSETAEAEHGAPLVQHCTNPAPLLKWYERQSEEDDLRALIVYHDGKVILEGPLAGKEGKVRSVSKSISSLVAGHMIEADSLDELVWPIMPELKERYPTLTWRHLLSMTAGYDAVGGFLGEHHSGAKDNSQRPELVADPMFAPGESAVYWTDATRLLAYLLEQKHEKTFNEILEEKIKKPLDTLTGRFTSLKGSKALGRAISDAAGGFHVSSRDLGRIGEELRSTPESIVPLTWFDEMLKVQVAAELPLWEGNPKHYDPRGQYGLGWWLNKKGASGKRPWPKLDDKVFAARGAKKSMLLIDPSNQLVWSLVPHDVEKLKSTNPSHEWIDELTASLIKAIKACEKPPSAWQRFKNFISK